MPISTGQSLTVLISELTPPKAERWSTGLSIHCTSTEYWIAVKVFCDAGLRLGQFLRAFVPIRGELYQFKGVGPATMTASELSKTSINVRLTDQGKCHLSNLRL